MDTTYRFLLIVLPALLFLSLPVAAQQTAPGTVEEELHALRLHTGETVNLLRELITQGAEDQKLKRLQVAVLAIHRHRRDRGADSNPRRQSSGGE